VGLLNAFFDDPFCLWPGSIATHCGTIIYFDSPRLAGPPRTLLNPLRRAFLFALLNPPAGTTRTLQRGVRRLVAAFGSFRLSATVAWHRDLHSKHPKAVTSPRTPCSTQNGSQPLHCLSCASCVPLVHQPTLRLELLSRLPLRLFGQFHGRRPPAQFCTTKSAILACRFMERPLWGIVIAMTSGFTEHALVEWIFTGQSQIPGGYSTNLELKSPPFGVNWGGWVLVAVDWFGKLDPGVARPCGTPPGLPG